MEKNIKLHFPLLQSSPWPISHSLLRSRYFGFGVKSPLDPRILEGDGSDFRSYGTPKLGPNQTIGSFQARVELLLAREQRRMAGCHPRRSQNPKP